MDPLDLPPHDPPPVRPAATVPPPVPSVRLEGLGAGVISGLRRRFSDQRRLAEVALAQASDDAFFERIGPLDPLAVQVKHVGGNLRSRFTDFLTDDGEKAGRERDEEFEVRRGDTREALMERWQEGWAALEATLASLVPDDLDRQVHIRGEGLSVIDALLRSLAHMSYHTGQIVALSKHAAGDAWQTLSVPRGGSAQYTADARARHARRS